jgi:hypothetical protein
VKARQEKVSGDISPEKMERKTVLIDNELCGY